MNQTIESLIMADLSDWKNRLVLADAFEENDFPVQAAYHRMVAAAQRRLPYWLLFDDARRLEWYVSLKVWGKQSVLVARRKWDELKYCTWPKIGRAHV